MKLIDSKTSLSFLFFFYLIILTNGQTIGTFNSIQPTSQTQNLVIPSTHAFQRLIRTGDALSLGGNLGSNLDFTGYVPIAASSTNGYLSISSESAPAECAILSVSFNAGPKTWTVNSGGKVSFPVSDLGIVAAFCSGTVTANNTVMVCEEVATNVDVNGDGYEDLGWVIEIDPATRTVINQDGVGGVDKLWAVGRQVHENVVINSAQTIMYWGADASSTGYMYKFVPTVPGNFSSGLLYVLQTTGALGTGTWQLINNTTQADRNNTVSLSTSAGAFNFDGIEDVEIGPDGKIYFTAKAAGVIYRYRDLGTSVDQLEVFVESTNYDVDGTGPFASEPWGTGNDNLAFDGEGKLWVLQDGGRNHIWVVGPTHTAATPDVRLFATTPAGSEPTGITFTPDYKYMFLSFQHPNGSNASSQTDDAGASVIFNTPTTVVIARKEFLGTSVVPLRFANIDLRQKENGVEISWNVRDVYNHSYFEIERSENGIQFERIHRNIETLDNFINRNFRYNDQNLPGKDVLYYRIKQCDKDGSCKYSDIKRISFSLKTGTIKLFPVPASKTLNVSYTSLTTSAIIISIIDGVGRTLQREVKKVNSGSNTLSVNTERLVTGKYNLIIEGENNKRIVQPFTKL